MALEGQLTYLSAESQPDLQRSRVPRRSPRLRVHEEEEEEDGEGKKGDDFGTRAPIIGYEVVDQRQKFTVYKIQVNTAGKKWFVFRRYTDFTRLNERLQDAYPNFKIRLPGKRWFKDNFDPAFIEERARGLQFFINNLMNHSEISQSPEIHEFFCLSDPPGPYDSLEESRAYCQHLESQVEDLKQKVDELTAELEMTKSQLTQARVQQEALVSALKSERTIRKKSAAERGNDSAHTDDMIAEHERRTRSSSLRGKFTQSLPPQHRHRTNSKGKLVMAGSVLEDDKNLWEGSLEIAEHSSGADRMRPSKLGRRHSEERRAPRTSTPVDNSDLGSTQPKAATYLEESLNDSKEGIKKPEAIGELDFTGVLPTEALQQGIENSHYGGMIRKRSSEQARKHSSKRDSGISVDNSPTPST